MNEPRIVRVEERSARVIRLPMLERVQVIRSGVTGSPGLPAPPEPDPDLVLMYSISKL